MISACWSTRSPRFMTPLAEAVYNRALQMVDPTGAWAEYYLNGSPQGTRCRPWESAINIVALLNYAEQQGK